MCLKSQGSTAISLMSAVVSFGGDVLGGVDVDGARVVHPRSEVVVQIRVGLGSKLFPGRAAVGGLPDAVVLMRDVDDAWIRRIDREVSSGALADLLPHAGHQ